MISTRDLTALPGIDALRQLMQAMAVLDAILSPDWEYRYFSFDSRWGKQEQLGSMRSGHGDHYFAFFSAEGCWIKGFDPEAPMAEFDRNSPKIAQEVLGDVPREFAGCLREPAFLLEETTFCVWRRFKDARWNRGRVQFPRQEADADGSARLLSILDGRPETYHDWAQDYYGRQLPLEIVRELYAGQPLEDRMIRALNPEVSPRELRADFKEIGYPRA
ncbi:MAG: hypothetical protein ACTHLZ_18510 [Tepidisphaeraceae bacterium]